MYKAESNELPFTVEQILSDMPEQCRTCPRAHADAFDIRWVVELERISPSQAATLIMERSTCLSSTETY